MSESHDYSLQPYAFDHLQARYCEENFRAESCLCLAIANHGMYKGMTIQQLMENFLNTPETYMKIEACLEKLALN